jgi:hypothetical protein
MKFKQFTTLGLALVISISAFAANKRQSPLSWVKGTVLEVEDAERYEGENARSSQSTEAEYAPIRVFTVETDRYTYRVKWFGSSGQIHRGTGALGMALDGWGIARAGHAPELSPGEELTVAEYGSYLYMDLGGKKAPGFRIASKRLTRRREAPKEETPREEQPTILQNHD